MDCPKFRHGLSDPALTRWVSGLCEELRSQVGRKAQMDHLKPGCGLHVGYMWDICGLYMGYYIDIYIYRYSWINQLQYYIGYVYLVYIWCVYICAYVYYIYIRIYRLRNHRSYLGCTSKLKQVEVSNWFYSNFQKMERPITTMIASIFLGLL